MTTNQILDIIGQISKYNIEFLILSGGDPFLRNDIIVILEAISDTGINIQISTKQFLTNEMANNLKRLNLDTVQISIDSINDSLNEFMIGVPDYFKRISNTIRKLQSNGINVTTNTVVTSHNIAEIPALVNRLYEMDIQLMRLSQYYRSAYYHDERLFITNDDIAKLISFINEFNSKNGSAHANFSGSTTENMLDFDILMERFLKRPLCTAGRMSFVIMPNGKVIPCEQLPCRDEFIIGDCTTQSLEEIWNSRKFRELINPNREKYRNTPCFECNHFSNCITKKGNCIRDSWKAYNTPYQIHPLCPNAKHMPGRRLS